jgi:hypothetical protein
MEYIAGETLKERLIPWPYFLVGDSTTGSEVAEALEIQKENR